MKCQKTIDARKFSHQALEEMRVSAVARVEAGESPERVAEGLGINRRTIYRWLSAYHYGGVEAIKAKPIPGAPAKVCAKQMAQLSRIIREKNPLQLKFEYALWTLAMIRELIWRKFNVHLSEVSVGRLMKRIGFSPQRPLYRAWQQDPALVDRWREKDYPRIAARAKREGAQIFFADESGIRSDTHTGTTWAPVGETPIVQATGARFSLNRLSAVNAQGGFRFMTVEGRVTAPVFRDFLSRLITGVDRKIFLIVDGHPVHKARLVRTFVEDNRDRIELFFSALRAGAEPRRTDVGACQGENRQSDGPDKGMAKGRNSSRHVPTAEDAGDCCRFLPCAGLPIRHVMRFDLRMA